MKLLDEDPEEPELYGIKWIIQVGFNKQFEDSPLEICREINLSFRQKERNDLDQDKTVGSQECEQISEIYVKIQTS